MQQLVERNAMAGVVTMVVSRDSVLHLQATGRSDLASQRPMATDDLFSIASMTKPVTASAVLMLQDEGRLNVTDEVARYLPQFATLRTPSGQLAHFGLERGHECRRQRHARQPRAFLSGEPDRIRTRDLLGI
jgi:CubicO group peptidase (beta-lactamase class C family)